MVVYVEYVILENFFFDGVLLCLALLGARKRISFKRLCVSAFLGGVGSLAFPILRLPNFFITILKTAFGILLTLCAFGRIKNKNERGRYALSCVFFFLLTFSFGGVITFFGVKTAYVGLCFVCLALLTAVFIVKMRKRRAIYRFVYECELVYKEKTVNILGFYDSGNFATYTGVPICFISPDTAFSLIDTGQVCDETAISKVQTVSGEKNMRLFKGKVRIKDEGKILEKEVYFSISGNMLSREYQLILHSEIFDKQR